LGTNTKKSTVRFREKKVKVLYSGEDEDWSSSLLAILEQLKEKNIFIWLDDIFPIAEINEKRFAQVFAFMNHSGSFHIHMRPMPKPDAISMDSNYGVYAPGSPYRVNSMGFWDVSYLKTLLLAGESPWDFEIMGSYRSSYTKEGFYCCAKPLFEYLHVVEKGKYFPEAVQYARTHNIHLDCNRETLRSEASFKSSVQKIIFNSMLSIPWKQRVGLMNMLRKLFVSY